MLQEMGRCYLAKGSCEFAHTEEVGYGAQLLVLLVLLLLLLLPPPPPLLSLL